MYGSLNRVLASYTDDEYIGLIEEEYDQFLERR